MQGNKGLWLLGGAIVISGLVIAILNAERLGKGLGWIEEAPKPALLSEPMETQSTKPHIAVNLPEAGSVDKRKTEEKVSISDNQQTEPQLSSELEQLLAELERSVAEIEQLPPDERKQAEPLLQELERLKDELKKAHLEGQRLQQDVQAKTEASEALNKQIEAIRQQLQ